MEINTTRMIRSLGAAVLLTLTGCIDDRVVDRNNAPVARARVQGHDPVLRAPSEYLIRLQEPDDTIELTLDASETTDVDGDEVTEYLWLSGTLEPGGGEGRHVPEGLDETWPDDGVTTGVSLGQGDWYFHVWARDARGDFSEPATLHLCVTAANVTTARVPLECDLVLPPDAGAADDDAGIDDADAGMQGDAGP